MGFRSVFNITDIPAFVSSGKLTVFDPTQALFDDKKGCEWDVAHVPDSVLDAFKVGQAAGAQLASNTVFRFAIRTAEQAERRNVIRNVAITMDSIRNIIAAGEDMLSTCLLFLRNVEDISVLHVSETGATR